MTCTIGEDLKSLTAGSDLFIIVDYEIQQTYARNIFIDGDYIRVITGGRDIGGYETTLSCDNTQVDNTELTCVHLSKESALECLINMLSDLIKSFSDQYSDEEGIIVDTIVSLLDAVALLNDENSIIEIHNKLLTKVNSLSDSTILILIDNLLAETEVVDKFNTASTDSVKVLINKLSSMINSLSESDIIDIVDGLLSNVSSLSESTAIDLINKCLNKVAVLGEDNVNTLITTLIGKITFTDDTQRDTTIQHLINEIDSVGADVTTQLIKENIISSLQNSISLLQ